jgi:peptide/nickel transport system substrate-binding protein
MIQITGKKGLVMKIVRRLSTVFLILLVLIGCGKEVELSVEEAEALKESAKNEILAKTASKPGGGEFAIGKVGGSWVASINNDPKTFNTITARDEDTRTVIDPLYDYLADYDPYKREFVPNLASFEVITDEAKDKLTVVYTLRDDLYWTNPKNNPPGGIRVTSDDAVFWYNEIEGDKSLQHPGYPGQFVELADVGRAHIDIEKIDDRRFAFHYPRIVANPILSTNMFFGPRYIYERAKREKGIEGVLSVFSVDTDVQNIPSIGEYYLIEYSPGVRVVMRRNPNHWKKDKAGMVLPYIEEVIYKVVPDVNTEYLLFKEGTKDSYVVRPEDLDELLNQENPNYTVYNGGESLGSAFFCFNQNQDYMDKTVWSWFIQTKFRQAMSCMLNRERISQQVYRGLAVPAVHFFARPNPYFDETIKLEYTFDPEQAVKLLSEIEISRDKEGIMRDKDGSQIEFTINVGAENNIGVDMCNIFADELAEIGITANVRPIDFQKLVEMLISTYEWQVVTAGLGANYWPESGSNVWQSSGNFHLWHPLQEKPATEWEARIDYLYNAGRFTLDREKAKEIYDEYQKLLLEQLPMMYIVHPLRFLAVRDKWDNVFYDTLNGLDSTYVFRKRD